MQFEEILSRDNPKIKQVVKLVNSSKYRNQSGLFVIEGARLCADAASSGIEIEMLMFTQSALDKYHGYIESVISVSKSCYLVGQSAFDKISDTETSQGVVCVCKKKDNGLCVSKDCRYVAVENISNPSNFGAIARTAEALGVDGILIIGNCCDLYSPKSVRASMGSVFRIGVNKLEYNEFFSLKQKGMKIYSSVVDAQAEKVTDVKFSDGSIVVLGNEGNGITDLVKQQSDNLITIPIKGNAESFNVAAAAAILLWELTK